jgi:hypothetical protein
MAWALVQSNEGVAATATVTPTFTVTPTSGNLVVLAFAADDYNGTPDTGWTQSTGLEQQTFHGGYIWWQVSTGVQPPTYTIGSATQSAWVLAEFSGGAASPYDISNGTFTQSNGAAQATPSIIPTTGQRLLVAMLGGSLGGSVSLAAETVSFSNSFTTIRDIGSSAGVTNDTVGMGYRVVTGDGSTGFTTTGTNTNNNLQSRSGLIISFKEAVPAGPYSPTYRDWPLRQRHPKMRGAT